jgi:hypothetical protein
MMDNLNDVGRHVIVVFTDLIGRGRSYRVQVLASPLAGQSLLKIGGSGHGAAHEEPRSVTAEKPEANGGRALVTTTRMRVTSKGVARNLEFAKLESTEKQQITDSRTIWNALIVGASTRYRGDDSDETFTT